MKKKLITATLLSVAALALVVASVLGTIAILSSSSAVSNVFTVGDVKINMFESKVNPDGVKIDANGTPIQGTNASAKPVEVDTNSYHLVPGKTYVKDPTIRITSDFESDQMYLFVKSRNQIREIEDANVNGDGESDTAHLSMRQQMENNGWVEFVQSGDGIEIVWVYGTRDADGVITPTAVTKTSKQKLKDHQVERDGAVAGEFLLCSEFTIDENVDANISRYASAKVNFTAFAVQTSGMSTGADDENIAKNAWTAIKNEYSFESGIINPVNPYDPNLKGDDAYDPVAKQ